MLRLVVATSVGLVLVLGVLRLLRGWAVHRLLIGGYVVVLAATFVAPPEIVGLAYDSGGVTTNVVTVRWSPRSGSGWPTRSGAAARSRTASGWSPCA